MSRFGWVLIAVCCLAGAAGSGCTQSKSLVRRFNPDRRRDFEMRLTMAQVHEQEGKLPKAGEIYASLNAERPQHPKVCHRYGVVLMGLGKDEEGLQLLERANGLDPQNAAILGDLGYAYVMAGELDQGETLLKQSHDLDPSNRRTVNNLALAAGLAGRFEESQLLYEQVMTKAEAQANLGYISAQRGEGWRALEHYNRALDLDPTLRPAAEALAQLADMKRSTERQSPATAQWAARQVMESPTEPTGDAAVKIRLTGGVSESQE